MFANAGALGHGLAEDVTEAALAAADQYQSGRGVAHGESSGVLVETGQSCARQYYNHLFNGRVFVQAGGGGTYAAAKHGVVGLARAWAHEFGPYEVRVNTVHPSAVGTQLVLNLENLTTCTARPGGSPTRGRT